MRLSHAETQALISARLDGPLDPVAERELNAHLATCESCRAFNASATHLARGLQSLPYLPASPAVARAVLDHVSTPRSPWSWIPGALPANALPAATAIATAVIVVFVGSFAAFRFLDDDDEPSTLPASTLTVTDLAQGIAETAEATEADDAVEGQAAVTEESSGPAERNPATEPAAAADQSTLDADSTEATETEPEVIGPPESTEASDAAESQLAPDEPTAEPTAEPTEIPEPTAEPTPVPPATLSASIRQALGLETAVPTEEPTPEPTAEPAPTDEPTLEPTSTPEPTLEPTEEPTALPTEAPTPTASAEPSEEPSELGDNMRIVGPPESSTAEPTTAPTSEPTLPPTSEPTIEPTAPPTDLPTATLEPRPEPTDEPEPTEVLDPTAVPIVQRDETPVDLGEDEGQDEALDDGSQSDETIIGESDDPDGTDPPIIESDRTDGDTASPESDQTLQSIDADDDGDGSDQVIEPPSGDDQGSPDDLDDGPEDDSGQGGPGEDVEGDGGSLADANIYASLSDVPGDPGARLGLSADGTLIFSSNPGRVSLEQDGVSLETGQGPMGQVVVACDANGSCVDISSASASTEGHIDNPIGWLGGEVIYERLNGDQYAVEFRAVALDSGSLQPGPDRLIDGGDANLATLIRPYPVDDALLVPSPAGWLRISSSSIEIVDGNPFGSIDLTRIDQASGRVSYVSGGSLNLASIGSPGSPEVQLPFSGSDYAVSPDGSRIAVVTGAGIEIWDTSGNVLTTYANDEGIQLGSLAWLNEGLVFVDLGNGVLRIVSP